MTTLPDDELEDLAGLLRDGEAAERAAALQVIAASPGADRRLVGPVEGLLEDRTPVIVSVPPPRVGQIRWLAARALAVLRGEPVVLAGAVEPLDAHGIAEAARAAGIPGSGGVDGACETYAALADSGALRGTDLVVDPASVR